MRKQDEKNKFVILLKQELSLNLFLICNSKILALKAED